MNPLALVLVGSMALFAVGCDSGGGGTPGSGTLSFITWNGSSNGAIVLDADDDDIRFRADTRQMYVFGTTISNVRVDGFRFLIDGQQFGTVANIESVSGNQITGLVSNNGFFLDVEPNGSGTTTSVSNLRPVFFATLEGARLVLHEGESLFEFGLGEFHAAEPATGLEALLAEPEPAVLESAAVAPSLR
jgi:hypothetical protein